MYIVTYFLRDGLNIPECIENQLKLLPFSFDQKINLINKLKKIEENKFPNQKSFMAYELHSEFGAELIKDGLLIVES